MIPAMMPKSFDDTLSSLTSFCSETRKSRPRLYMNGRPVSVLPPCYGPTMLIAFTSNFRLAATAVLATRQGQREVKLQIVPNENEDGWDIVDEAGIAAGVDLR